MNVDIKPCIHPSERSRYWLAIAVVVPIILVYVTLTRGVGLLIVPIILLNSWIVVRLFRAHLLGSCVRVSPDNFPEIAEMLKDICAKLEYPKKIETYVYQEGEVNAFLVRRFRTRIILLPHGLVEGMLDLENRPQLLWILSRSVGHLKAKHLRLNWLNILIESLEKLMILNIFLYPWERATQYSGDRIGLAVCTDLHAALRAMNRLMVGNELSGRATLLGALQQRQRLSGSVFAWLAECLSTHPHLTKRIASLIEWGKTYDSEFYESFMMKTQDRSGLEKLLHLQRSKLYPLKVAIAAVLVAGGPIVALGGPLILLPALSRARELAKRTLCSANLRGTGMAMYIYASDNSGDFPGDICTLVQTGEVSPRQLMCPSAGDWQSYYYVPGYGDNTPGNQIIMYEDPRNHQGEGGNVLRLDGSTRFVQSPAYDELIEAIKLPDGTPYAPHARGW